MTESILRKYTTRNLADGVDPESASDADTADDLGAFGWLRGTREKAIMLELRRKSGNIMALGYGWIERVEFDPSEGITLHALGQKFRIKGRNLNAEVRPTIRLFEGICRQRVPYVQESDQATLIRAEKTATVIEKLE